METLPVYGVHNVFIDRARPIEELLKACGFDRVDPNIVWDTFPDILMSKGSTLKYVPRLALVPTRELAAAALPEERETYCIEHGYRYANTRELLAYRELAPMRISGRSIIALGAHCDVDERLSVLSMWHSSYSALSLIKPQGIRWHVDNQALLVAEHGG